MKRIIVLLIISFQFTGILLSQTSRDPNSDNYLDYLSDKLNGLWTYLTGSGLFFGNIPTPYEFKFSNSPDISGTFPSSFDLRNNNVTAVKSQGTCGSCWAFATMAAIESEWKVAGYGTFNLSTNNLIQGSMFLKSPCEGGNVNMSIAYLTRMSGPIDSISDPYNPSTTYNISNIQPIAYISDARFIKWRSNSGINILKKAIMDYGGLYTTLRWEDASYNATNFTYFYNGIKAPNHSVVIVGWDNSIHTTNGDGAWIVKNSWGNWGDNGYFYVSYLDTRILSDGAAYFPKRVPFDTNLTIYGYDDLGATVFRGFESNIAYGMAKFTSASSQQLEKVSTWIISENTTIDIEIYENFESGNLSKLVSSLYNQICENPGYYSFDLPSSITLKRGQNFYVKIKYNTPYSTTPLPCEQTLENYANPTLETNKCWVSPDGNSWQATGIGTNELFDICIKAHSVKNPIKISNIEYFLDFDPGFGNGSQVLVSAINDISKIINIPLLGISNGFHTLYIRAKDNNDNWSITQNMPFYKLHVASSNISKLEYFVDTDPGLGNGTQVSISVINEVTESINIPLSGISNGFHTIYIRAKDNNGNWSVTSKSVFYKIDVSSPEIVEMEYFLDTDPGFGNAIPVTVTKGADVIKNINIDLSNVSKGFHTLYIRAKNATSKWSLNTVNAFYCMQPKTTRITELEYFFDMDPGFGYGTSIPITPTTSDITKLFNIDLACLSAGNHTFYVRTKNDMGNWSLINSKNITVTVTSPIINQNGNVLHSNALIGNQWYNEKGLINGATNQDYVLTSNGNYYVIITRSGCSSVKSNTISIINVGVEQAKLNNSIKIYPNPTTESFHIDGFEGKASLKLIAVSGNEILTKQIIGNETISVSNLPKGVYIVKVITAGGIVERKLMKK